MDKPCALLISPPVYDFALYDLFLKPYGLLRIGRWLHDSGWDVIFIDSLSWSDPVSLKTLNKPVRRANGTGKYFRQTVRNPDIFKKSGRTYSRYGITGDSLVHQIKSINKPDIVFVSSSMTYWYEGVFEAVRTVKKILPGVPVAVGGIYASLLTRHCIEKSGADYTVKGDGIDELKTILGRLSLPVPAGIPEEKVLQDPLWKESGVIRLNKGCPLNCRYCASSVISEFREGSADSAFVQLEEYVMKWSTSNIAFYDDALLHKKDSLLVPFLERVYEADFNINFYLPNAVHVNYLDFKTADLMKKCGFREIRLGFESSSADFHQKNDRKVSSHSFENTLDELFAAGFKSDEIIVYLLAGLPEQEMEEVRDSVNYLRKFGVKISISEYSPVPGSSLWDKSVEKSIFPIAEDPFYQNNSLFPLQWEKFTKKDMADLKNLARS